jgi:hypothetical protein
MPKFFETTMGAVFYQGTMPRIARALERIADILEKDKAGEERLDVYPDWQEIEKVKKIKKDLK